ncbi:hypothetical protein FBZ99_11814 [Rhizobium sp. ERR 1071]|nr:hypothetical protein FBZ99_11814 [Rhizobium sp. ERR1071]
MVTQAANVAEAAYKSATRARAVQPTIFPNLWRCAQTGRFELTAGHTPNMQAVPFSLLDLVCRQVATSSNSVAEFVCSY